MGFATLKTVLENGKDVVDISFFDDDPFKLDGLASEHGRIALVDCGVAPGMSNMLAGHAAAVLDPCTRIEILVGGLPVERRWPYEYKAGFAPHDVIEEYVRPARLVLGGQVVVREALSDPELVDFEGIGTLEAFNTDGLRSLVRSLSVPDMIEKTMRYPGHIELMRVLRDTGLFSKDPIEVDGHCIRPLDVTARLMFPKWTFDEGEADLTVLRVRALGKHEGRDVCMRWDLLDRYDAQTRTRSMSRTTAFPATIMARALLDGRFREPGVFAPEAVARVPGLVEHVLDQLRKRGVRFTASVD